ncbi:MAG: hypothetical protein NUV57_03125 [archaeon]|nr:hypothetical protein [archaeon]
MPRLFKSEIKPRVFFAPDEKRRSGKTRSFTDPHLLRKINVQKIQVSGMLIDATVLTLANGKIFARIIDPIDNHSRLVRFDSAGWTRVPVKSEQKILAKIKVANPKLNF